MTPQNSSARKTMEIVKNARYYKQKEEERAQLRRNAFIKNEQKKENRINQLVENHNELVKQGIIRQSEYNATMKAIKNHFQFKWYWPREILGI